MTIWSVAVRTGRRYHLLMTHFQDAMIRELGLAKKQAKQQVRSQSSWPFKSLKDQKAEDWLTSSSLSSIPPSSATLNASSIGISSSSSLTSSYSHSSSSSSSLCYSSSSYLSDVLSPSWMPALLELQDSNIHHWGHLVIYLTIFLFCILLLVRNIANHWQCSSTTGGHIIAIFIMIIIMVMMMMMCRELLL